MLYPSRKKLISFRLWVLVLIGTSLDLSSPILYDQLNAIVKRDCFELKDFVFLKKIEKLFFFNQKFCKGTFEC